MPTHSRPGPSGRRFDLEQLLDAARDVFLERGYASAEMREIATRAGTTKPTLYARLGGKEEIYLRVLAAESRHLRERIDLAYGGAREVSLSTLAQSAMAPLFAYADERPGGFSLLFRADLMGGRGERIRREVLTEVTERLARLIRERAEDRAAAEVIPAAGLLAAACVGVAYQVCEHAVEGGLPLRSAQAIATRFVTAAFRGLDLHGLEGP